jgi:hypothetical protein
MFKHRCFTNDYLTTAPECRLGRCTQGGVLTKALAESGSVDGRRLAFPQAILASARQLRRDGRGRAYLAVQVDWRILPLGMASLAAGCFTPPASQVPSSCDLICFRVPPFQCWAPFLFTQASDGPAESSPIGDNLYIGNVPDAEADRAVGKTTLSTLLGRRAVRVLGPLYYGLSYLLLAAAVAARLFPAWALLGLLPLPLAARALVIAGKNYDDIPRFAPAILITVQVFALSTLLLGLGFDRALTGRTLASAVGRRSACRH